MRLRAWSVLLLLAATLAPAAAQDAAPHAIDLPRWFVEGFLDLREEAAAADRQGKRLLVYFGQDGCPYCRELMQNNFSQRAIVDKTRRHFEAIALNRAGIEMQAKEHGIGMRIGDGGALLPAHGDVFRARQHHFETQRLQG